MKNQNQKNFKFIPKIKTINIGVRVYSVYTLDPIETIIKYLYCKLCITTI